MKLYWLILFSLPYAPSFAQQQYSFQHLTSEDGLLSNPKVNMYQDSLGFYWFSSVIGLQRFDGKNFIVYKYDYADKNISGDWVAKPVEDKEKNIWIENENGINIFDRQHRQLTRFYTPDAKDSNSNNVAGIIKSKQNEIWIITSKNIFRYDYARHKVFLVANIVTNSEGGISFPVYDSVYERIWFLVFGDPIKLGYFDCKTQKYNYVFKNIDPLLAHNNNPVSLFNLDKDGNLWMANFIGDFCRYNTNSGAVEHYNILQQRNKQKNASPNSALYTCLDDGSNNIWFGGDFYIGLLRYDKKTDSFSKVEYENASEYGLHYNENIYSLYKDREGNIWVDTDLGMNIFNPFQQQFKYLSRQAHPASTQFGANVTSVFQSRSGDIWVSTWGDGIFRYDSNFNLTKHYVHEKNNPYSLGEPLNKTWCFGEDNKGKIWVGCQYGMLSVLDTATGKFTNRIIPEFNRSTIMHIAKDAKNNFWMGVFHGMLAKLNMDSNKLIVYKISKNINAIDGLFVDGNDVWFSGERGLYCFDAMRSKITDSALLSQHVFLPGALNDSVIIGGTSGSGFFMLNKFTKSVKFFTASKEIFSNIVYGGTASDKNDIWIFTSDGIQRLNLPAQKISGFGINDGIRDHVFERAFCKLKNGIILIAGASGVIDFNPASITNRPSPPDVMITSFSAMQKDLSVDSLLLYKQIKLAHNENLVTIDYASLSFSGRKTDHYFYQLRGVNKTWIDAGAAQSVTYANLLPGNYVFEVKAQNSDDIFTKNITELSIVILPAWWQTWWAYLLWLVIACTIAYAVYDYRKRSRNALATVRRRIASDLHDDIGSTLNSISFYSEVASQQLQSDTENARSILQKMGNASRNMIDIMNDIVWSINPKNDQFENILQRMKYFSGELLSAKNISMQFHAHEKIKGIKLPMDKRKNFYLIFKEAMNNACKYSKAKFVSVNIAEEAGKLIMIITDDGIGFDMHNMLTGNGLKNMQTRALEMHAGLKIISEPQKGTRIELTIPVK